MTLNEMIYKRKSCRSFMNTPVDEAVIEKIKAFPMKPLYPEIKVQWNITPRKQVKCICPWTTSQLITVYSEKTEGWWENVGFLFQQMDLYLQSLGLGVCWLGMGRMNPRTAPEVPGMQFVIMLAFGYPKGEQLRQSVEEFNRKKPEQIADQTDPRLEPVRLAPSAVNSQPWYFVHWDDILHVYCIKNGRVGYMNRIDMGIGLAHLYVANEDSFHFFKSENPPEVAEYDYIGSVTL
ncbi:MAG: nitroreductase [Ruminococcaceae bacterium]|nr:nitroreductase [Oscillospiraceae bacterium]